MPVIEQQGVGNQAVKRVAGLPDRWGRKAYLELSTALADKEAAARTLKNVQDNPRRVGPDQADAIYGRMAERYANLSRMLDAITSAPIPVDATDAHLCILAERYANDCAGIPVVEMSTRYVPMPIDPTAPGDGIGPRQYGQAGEVKPTRDRLADICKLRGIEPPTCADDGEAVKRMVDPNWWRMSLRRAHGRAFEHAAMRLGFVSVKAGSYCSDETATRRHQQVERNNAALKAAMIKNEHGQEFSLYDLAQKGMANKSLRKGELMLRMAGCEEIAREYQHVGLFVTGTCPSKYHAVTHKEGKTNPKYLEAGCPSPRRAQEFLNTAWARTRAQNQRDGIAPYGFRIAEPHHDGTPHWHMLLFMPANQVEAFKRNLSVHWLAEDGYEDGAITNRVKFVQIDPGKGTAAGYIAKYVGKNIDDSQGGAFDEEGPAMLDGVTPACARVDAWASVWGIRQFQGIGMPPVIVWRELRRVKEDHQDAPDYLQRALTASRRIEGHGPTTDGKPLVLQAANFAEYIRAQGGVHLGRDYRIRIVSDQEQAEGRYGVIWRILPIGVQAVTDLEVIYPSKRFTWTRAARKSPRSPLNNCTRRPAPPGADPFWWEVEPVDLDDFDDAEWYASQEFEENWIEPQHAAAIEVAALAWYEETRPAREARAAEYAANLAAQRAAKAAKRKNHVS